MAYLLQSLPKVFEKKYEKGRKYLKPISSFLAMFFKTFFYLVIKTLDYSQLIRMIYNEKQKNKKKKKKKKKTLLKK